MYRPNLRTVARRSTKVVLVGTAVALAVPTIVGAVTGGNPTPQRATGCLKTDGTIIQYALGDAPKAACTSTQKQITFGNGDITGITPGNGLAGGGVEGTVTLGLTAKYSLPQGCASGSPSKASSTGWYCGSDNGSLRKTVAVADIDHQTPPYNGNTCVGDYASYVPPITHKNTTSATFTLPTGTYMPTTNASTRWFVNRTYDLLDGEQFTKGYLQMQVIRTRAGIDTTVATWARAESDNSDGAGLPYNQDLGSFTTLSTDTYRIVAEGSGDYCSRARLLSPAIDFTLVG